MAPNEQIAIESFWSFAAMIVKFLTARVYTNVKYCNCPGSEIGKIVADRQAHLADCQYHKVKGKIKITDLTVPRKIRDDYGLGVAL